MNYSCDKARDDKATKIKETETNAVLDADWQKKSRASSRGIGIKDQRRELQYSQASNTEMYSELGELREINSFIKNEEERFNKLYDFEGIDNEGDDRIELRPIFRVINFFKRL